MKTILKRGALLYLTIIASLFGFTTTKVDSGFKAVHISWLFQMLQDNKLVPLRQSVDVFYSKTFLIARTRAMNFRTDTKLRPGTDEVLEEKTFIDSSYVYYITRRGEKHGLAFDSSSIATGKGIKLDVDSFVKSTLRAPAFFYGLKSKGKDSVNIQKDERTGTLIEKYLYRRREVQEPDSIYFYFRKQPMEFSFTVNNRHDDGMYLYKARAICNAAPQGRFSNVNVDVEKYEHSFEITEIAVNEKDVNSIIDKFQKLTNGNK